MSSDGRVEEQTLRAVGTTSDPRFTVEVSNLDGFLEDVQSTLMAFAAVVAA
eukprot:CAMPEP_0185764372 /NCGR_PEP_ID=MMETSP1174-20130828/23303_1 /TAXON_ID=35687 /ORGANISM="Dictyocha speculum, Strain CCMP1381" /LENGTH=50 /DNA_ID=CAMNT_0028446867 /DNA_START=670 /DNA_END=822 /DNA_ORIENTATION=-